MTRQAAQTYEEEEREEKSKETEGRVRDGAVNDVAILRRKEGGKGEK